MRETFPNEPVYPSEGHNGITNREYFALEMLKILGGSRVSPHIAGKTTMEHVCQDAVAWADGLIAALSR